MINYFVQLWGRLPAKRTSNNQGAFPGTRVTDIVDAMLEMAQNIRAWIYETVEIEGDNAASYNMCMVHI